MNPFKKLYCRAFQTGMRIALPFMPYKDPAPIGGLDGVPAVLRRHGISRVLLVTDRTVRGLSLTAPLEQALAEAGVACTVYDGTVPNPTTDNVAEALALYRANDCQGLIGFGGGSSIDCAKAAGARVAKPRQSVQKMRGLLKIHRKLPTLVAIPTTAGTGSETTLAAVITDSDTHHKYPINDFVLIPRYAVLDYHVTTGLPRQITATTGMDALTHAVEAYIGGSTTKLTRRMAEEAVRRIHADLKRAYDDGSDAKARESMLRAAYCAGIAFTRSYVGYVHGVAHSLGGRYGIPHGLANAVILPYFLEEYGESCEKRLGKLARICGIAPGEADDHAASSQFIQWVKDMNRSMEIPEKLEGIQEEDIRQMAAHADRESNPLYPVPRLMDAEELAAMYRKIAVQGDAYSRRANGLAAERKQEKWKSAIS